MLEDQLIQLTVALIAILNPIGNAAIFLGMTSSQSSREQHMTAITCAFAVAIILVITTWVGTELLDIFGISIGAFQAAGGLIVTLIGLSMMKGHPHTHTMYKKDKIAKNPQKHHLAVVPLAIPIVAGPGAMTTLIAHMHTLNTMPDKIIISIICIVLSIIVGVVLFISPFMGRMLGENGMKIITRIMGLILISIAFQMLAAGLISLFPSLG